MEQWTAQQVRPLPTAAMAATCAGIGLPLITAVPAPHRLHTSRLLTCFAWCCVCACSGSQLRAGGPQSSRSGRTSALASFAAVVPTKLHLMPQSLAPLASRSTAAALVSLCSRSCVLRVRCLVRSARRPTRPMWRPAGLLDGQTYRSIMWRDRVYGKTSHWDVYVTFYNALCKNE